MAESERERRREAGYLYRPKRKLITLRWAVQTNIGTSIQCCGSVCSTCVVSGLKKPDKCLSVSQSTPKQATLPKPNCASCFMLGYDNIIYGKRIESCLVLGFGLLAYLPFLFSFFLILYCIRSLSFCMPLFLAIRPAILEFVADWLLLDVWAAILSGMSGFLSKPL